MKAFWRAVWTTICIGGAGTAGIYFGWQHNLFGAAILGLLGMSLGIVLSSLSPWQIVHGLFELFNGA